MPHPSSACCEPAQLPHLPCPRQRGGWRMFLALLAAATLGAGCAELPKDVHRPVSRALETPASTPLGKLVEERRAAAGARHSSGFLLLSGPQAAYGSRLALVEGAQKTLDLQYYAIHADASTERLLRGIVAAAERGVRVRVLLDDFHTTGRDALVMRLAFVPNIEMRMFNPVSGARSSTVGRMLSALAEFSRVQQRMHNKLFIADNVLGVTGGRNLGDAYFGHADGGNFVDLDVLAAGPIVQDLSRSFDSYWNNDRAYPVQSLVTRKELDALRERLEAADAAQKERPPGEANVPLPAAPVPPAAAAPATAASAPASAAEGAIAAATADAEREVPVEQSPVWDHKPMDLSRADFVWAPAAVLVDKPAKIPADGTPPTLPERAPAQASPMTIVAGGAKAAAAARAKASASEPASVPGAAAAAPDPSTLDAQTDTVVDGLLHLMGQARRDLLIISPYFVPGPDMKQAFAAARARGVRVRVLTNSLASNDAPIAHAGYARHRPDLLAMGVELYEMRSELPSSLTGALGSGSGSGSGSGGKAGGDSVDGESKIGGSAGATGSMGSSRAMLHSKLLIMDGRLLAIGSMNLDMRSQLQNTEIALLIRSRALSDRAAAQIEEALRESAWRVELQNGGDLVWRAPEGSGLADATSEPDASLPLRLMLLLLGPLAPDHLL